MQFGPVWLPVLHRNSGPHQGRPNHLGGPSANRVQLALRSHLTSCWSLLHIAATSPFKVYIWLVLCDKAVFLNKSFMVYLQIAVWTKKRKHIHTKTAEETHKVKPEQYLIVMWKCGDGPSSLTWINHLCGNSMQKNRHMIHNKQEKMGNP